MKKDKEAERNSLAVERYYGIRNSSERVAPSHVRRVFEPTLMAKRKTDAFIASDNDEEEEEAVESAFEGSEEEKKPKSRKVRNIHSSLHTRAITNVILMCIENQSSCQKYI